MNRPIFQEPFADDGRGAFVEGLAGYSRASLADNYFVAADALIEHVFRAQPGPELTSTFESVELMYPILFLYRHGIELYLKCLYSDEERRKKHTLSEMISRFARDTHGRHDVPPWVVERLRELESFDPKATLFRYEDVDEDKRLRDEGEFWVDFDSLRPTMTAIRAVLRAMVRG